MSPWGRQQACTLRFADVAQVTQLSLNEQGRKEGNVLGFGWAPDNCVCTRHWAEKWVDSFLG